MCLWQLKLLFSNFVPNFTFQATNTTLSQDKSEKLTLKKHKVSTYLWFVIKNIHHKLLFWCVVVFSDHIETTCGIQVLHISVKHFSFRFYHKIECHKLNVFPSIISTEFLKFSVSSTWTWTELIEWAASSTPALLLNDPVSVRFWSIRAAARRELHGFIIVVEV